MYSRVYVEITNVCNLHCSFCHGHKREARQMSEQEFLRVLEQLEGKTQYIYYHLMGEPFLHPQLPVFLAHARSRGFRSVLTTNATLAARRGREVLEAGVYKVNLSLHSFEEGGEEARRQYLEQAIAFAEEAASGGTIAVLRLWNRGFDDAGNGAVWEYLKSHVAGEWVENTRGVRIHDKLHIEWGDRFVWPDRDAPSLGEDVRCYGLCDHFGILADGSVVPCCMDSDGVITLGNVFASPLDEILSSRRAVNIRDGFSRRHAEETLCKGCSYARRFG